MADEGIDLLVTPEKNGLDSWNKGITFARNSSSLDNGHSAHAHHRRASIGTYQMADSSRKNSNEKQESANRSQSSVPHYLRASTGSCHDLCKYGRQNAFEEKARTPLRSRLAKTSPIELNSVETLNSGEQKKEKAVRHKPSDNTKKHAPDLKSSPGIKFYSPKPKPSLNTKISSPRQNTSSANEIHLPKHEPSLSKKTLSPDSPEIIKREIVLPSEKVESPLKKSYSTDSEMLWTEIHYLSKKSSSGHLKPVKVKPSSSSNTSDGTHGKGRRNSDVTAGGKLTAFKASARKLMAAPATSLSSKNSLSKAISSSKARNASLSKKTLSPDSPEIIKREIVLPSEKVESPLKKSYSTDSEMLRTEKKTHYLSKKSSSGHLKPVKVKPSSSSDTSDGTHGEGRRNSDVTAGGKLTAFKASARKLMAAPATSLSFKNSLSKAISSKARKARSLKLASPPKDQNSICRTKAKTSNNEKVSEKTLHVIKTGTKNRALKSTPDCRAIPTVPSPSLPKSLSQAKSANLLSREEDTEGETEYSGSRAEVSVPENAGKTESVTRDLSKTLRKSRGVVSEDKHRSPVKLKFRSGKVVDLKSDNNSPWRLRFRRARGPGAQEGKGDSRTRILKKAEGNDNMNGAQLSSEMVVLKHQNVQSKKDAQGLFNNVIEETASKLVESRKSKVQALVGAFETVISLQDRKPSSLTVS